MGIHQTGSSPLHTVPVALDSIRRKYVGKDAISKSRHKTIEYAEKIKEAFGS